MYRRIFAFALLALLPVLTSCSNKEEAFDASGTFEAVETIISAEASGVIRQFSLEEGQTIPAGEVLGYIDTIQLHLKKKQLEAQITAMLGKKPDIPLQLSSLEDKLRKAESEKLRITNLLKGDAATRKDLDDIEAEIEFLNSQIEAQRSSLKITSKGLSNDAVPLEVQIMQLDDQIRKSVIVNPVNGTVISKYAEENEMASAGKALYKIADLSTIILRVYISGKQLPQIKLNQPVTVMTDDGRGGYSEGEGIITWISDKAEFTPKTVLTREERENNVYAVKVNVSNNGTYKIGMHGEIKFK